MTNTLADASLQLYLNYVLCLTMTNTLAYYIAVSLTTVKCFMVQAPVNFVTIPFPAKSLKSIQNSDIVFLLPKK